MIKSHKPNVARFIQQYEEEKAEMDSLRSTMSDRNFAKLFDVSEDTVERYMQPVVKNIKRWSVIAGIPPEEIHELRMVYSDSWLCKKYHCGIDTILKYFGTREENGLPIKQKAQPQPKKEKDKTEYEIRVKPQPKKEIPLKTDRWEYKEEKPYWMTEKATISGDNPHPFIYNKIAKSA